MKGARRILDELRRARVLVIHPGDEDCDLLRGHLKRLGCQVQTVWPPPAALPETVDTVFLSVDDAHEADMIQMLEGADVAVIAVVTYESPTTLQSIFDLNAHGVMSKPLRPLGILTQFTLARYRHQFEGRLNAKIRKLEETLKGRRVVDKAIRLLIDEQGMKEENAYRLLRDQATSERVPLSSIAEEIVAAHETMARLGLKPGRDSKAPKN
ncbi:ANTAR domain-containing response regulator [Antarctobacter heliothermus]|uniref:Two-component response regulator, AmiR/NasT family, consists of REC and RNA-binding antiterminator (ANTAR) domains n=1 Tax=Antarctobacter heliothermus TaxID=74033 RepID=A0A239B266_9RHOB|nr:ANTAR domain-containing protein [Antarctobacter heliothermus]SNS01889.1 Two-component response regulator, AmiR/NasT family, consists of REC and RNA-binding antiterminator (ANTAR) domains [Antarctobacter heliothermus]